MPTLRILIILTQQVRVDALVGWVERSKPQKQIPKAIIEYCRYKIRRVGILKFIMVLKQCDDAHRNSIVMCRN